MLNKAQKKLQELRSAYASAPRDIEMQRTLAQLILEDKKKRKEYWVMSWECCNQNYTFRNGATAFCSHRMPARISECVDLFPDRFEKAKVGRYTAYRML